MNLLLNISSNRELREGDAVRTKSGLIGKVVAFDIFESELIIVQDKKGRVGSYSPNDLEFVHEGPGLEPLPPIVTILQEGGVEENFRTCAGAICLKLTETSTTITLIPKDNSNLRETFRSDLPFKEAVEDILKRSYVTRLPHLVEQFCKPTENGE